MCPTRTIYNSINLCALMLQRVFRSISEKNYVNTREGKRAFRQLYNFHVYLICTNLNIVQIERGKHIIIVIIYNNCLYFISMT